MAVIHDGSDFACPKCREVLARKRRARTKKRREREARDASPGAAATDEASPVDVETSRAAAAADASRVAGGDEFARELAAQMLESLLGNPHAVFMDTGEEGKGSSRYRYLRVRSQNADWYRGFPGDQAKLRAAIARQARGAPLNLKRAEDRWLHDETERARVEGWSATFDGKESPIALEPEGKRDRLGLKFARLVVRPKPLRLYLAMPHKDVERVRARADQLHESPNLYLNHVLEDHLDRSDAADESSEVPF